MDGIFNAYMTESERAFAIQEAENDILLDKLYTMYETVEKKFDLNMREAELKVMKESGTYDDLAFLYTEAGEEAKEKKKNIISRIIEGILNILRGIKDKIKNLFGKVNPNNTVDMSQEEMEFAAKSEQFASSVQNVFTKIKTGVSENKEKVIGGITLLTIGGVAGAMVYNNKKKNKNGKPEEAEEAAETPASTGKEKVKKVTVAEAQKYVSRVQKVSDVITKALEDIQNLFKKDNSGQNPEAKAKEDAKEDTFFAAIQKRIQPGVKALQNFINKISGRILKSGAKADQPEKSANEEPDNDEVQEESATLFGVDIEDLLDISESVDDEAFNDFTDIFSEI